MRKIYSLGGIALAVSLLSCDEPAPASGETTATSSQAVVEATSAPAVSATAKSTAKKPSHPCPEGSEGEGTIQDPCKATGANRIMEVKWTGKIHDEKGPYFQVKNTTKLEIIFGKIVVYFYDKAGKQLEVKGVKPSSYRVCSGSIFAGPMRPEESAVLTFSCTKKANLPEGTHGIEAEMQMVGFTEKDGKKADTYWRNDDLVPESRPKGGIKK